MKQLVSVLLPLFRANQGFLEASVKSILSQTYDEFELLLLLDPSDTTTDNAICDALSEFHDDHRLRLIRNRKRLGIVASLNKGIQVSVGDYVARMDSDDVSEPIRIEEEINAMREQKLHFVGSWAQTIDEHGQVKGQISLPSDPATIRKYLMLHNPFLHSTIVFERAAMVNIGLYDKQFEYSEDYELYMRAFSRGLRGGNVQQYLQLLRENPISMTRGLGWRRNRIAYLKTKIAGAFQYHLNGPRDIVYLAITPCSFFLKPANVLGTKKLLGFYTPTKTFDPKEATRFPLKTGRV